MRVVVENTRDSERGRCWSCMHKIEDPDRTLTHCPYCCVEVNVDLARCDGHVKSFADLDVSRGTRIARLQIKLEGARRREDEFAIKAFESLIRNVNWGSRHAVLDG